MNWWKNSLLISCSFLWVPYVLYAQVPRDTSYTIRSTYLKQKKYYPDVSIPDVSVPSNVTVQWDMVYRVLKDRELTANLFIPEEIKPLPCVVMVHGGGWRTGDKSLMTSMAIRLAEAGYVAFVPEYRMSLEAEYPAAVHDLKAAVRYVRTNSDKYNIDDSRIAILGCSAGGQLAALVGTTNDSRKLEGSKKPEYSSAVHAIIDIDGVLKFRHPESNEGSMAAQWLGGTYEEAAKNWEDASALNHVSGKSPPTLFLASKYPRFLAGHREYMEMLNNYGIKTRRVDMGDAPHSFWLLNPWFQPTIDEVLLFLTELFYGE